MVLRIICVCLLGMGGVLTAATLVRYHRFLARKRGARYQSGYGGRPLEMLAQAALAFFVVGFMVGFFDILRNDVDPIFLFVAVVFFVGAVFIGLMVHVQINLDADLVAQTMAVMHSFVNSVEMKDPYTQGHSWHVYHIVRLFYPRLPAQLRAGVSEPKLLDAALLHDIGKIGVPDDVLKKKGPLTDAEWEAIRSHPARGKQMLAKTCYEEIGDWVLYHHERVDGGGYLGAKGEAIPLEARIIMVADTYSAITTDREYRPRRSHEAAMEIMREVAGTQLDPVLVEAFGEIDPADLAALQADLRGGGAGKTA